MGSERTEKLRERLLAWYEVEARDLPWRRTDDPYAILVSEIMLQQTRVDTVLSYYEPFLKRFPTVHVLADAPIDDVLKAWEGLGYYRRAHNLHRAARCVIDEHGGNLPSTASALRRLPGIGPYTAAAVASIAFGLDEPALDGNMIRVLSRLFCIGGDPASASVRSRLLEEARRLIPRGTASAFNQALMDLGARICVPRSPACGSCPIHAICDAHHAGREMLFPEKKKRSPIPHHDVATGVVWSSEPFSRDARLLIAQRHADDMLGGLWEFPGGGVEEGETIEEALSRELLEELGIDIDILSPFLTVKHAFTHFRITLHAYHCVHTSGTPAAIDCADWQWVSPGDFRRYAFSTADRKIISALLSQYAAPPGKR